MSALPPPDELAQFLLQDHPALFQALLDNELGGIYLIQDNRFVYASPRLAQIFGYPQQALCGRLGPLDLTAERDRPRVAAEIAQRLQQGQKNRRYQFCGLRQDGSELEVEVFGSTTRYQGRPAILGLLLDISAGIRAEQQIKEQLNFLQQLLEVMPNPVFYKDTLGRYTGCNNAFERYIGIQREQLLGKSVFDISPAELATRYHAADQALFDQPGTQIYEANVQSADKGRRDVVFYKATFNNTDGTLGGLVGVILDITERKQAESDAWQHANFDSLTGLPNRRLLYDRLHQELAHAQRSQQRLAVMFIDLDRFKEVNDSLGHSSGDQLLIQAAQRIQSLLRESDTVARQGGDEFVVILPQLMSDADVGPLADSILATMAEPFRLGNDEVHISASIGIACYPDDAEHIEALLNCADQAMYDAKNMGRNRFRYFSRDVQQATLARLQLGRELRQALAEGQLAVYYQPIVELASGQINKAEALLRWHHPQRGLILPNDFIPIAEDLGLIHALGDWVFRQAAGMAKRWQQSRTADAAPIQIAVNLSPRQIAHGEVHLSWPAYLAELGLPGQHLCVEITENALLDQRPEIAQHLAALRSAGICIALDDFGTGYSAMGYLKKFAIDGLKIDQSFIRDMLTQPGDRAIVEAIIAMSQKLGIRVVAEGLEQTQQCALLQQYGCDYGQGFLFAEALPATTFAAQQGIREGT